MSVINTLQNILAYYIRISVEDRNKAGKTDESDSVINQRALLKRYVEEHPDLRELQSIEFVDDGESGMTYERSAFLRLMDEVKKGTVKTIIVKDYSRFGRGYIDAGDYLEQIFPFLGVRFISVNDHYDSNRYKYGSAGMIDVGFKQIMHQYYSVSLSQKILCAHNQLAQKGKFHASYAFYGYIKSPEKYRLEIDEESAENIRYIFNAALQGKRNTQIAAELNEMKAPTPLWVLREHHKNIKNWNEKNCRYIWNADTVKRILQDERYTGTFIYGKTRVDKIGSRKMVSRPREEWTVIPGVFPVIISKEIFDKVNGKRKHIIKAETQKSCMFHNVVCGYCGMCLVYNDTENPYYKCMEYKNGVTVSCKGNRVYESDLKVLTLTALKEEAQNLLKQLHTAKQCAYKGAKANKIKALQLKLNAIPLKKETLFKQLLSGEITKEKNGVLYGKLEQEEKSLTEQIEALQSVTETVAFENDTVSFLQSLLKTKTLDIRTVKMFVKQIRVFMNDRIEISITLKPLNGKEEIVTKVYSVPEIKGKRVWIYYRTWYNEGKLQEQRNSLIKYAESKGWSIVGENGGYHSNSKKLFEQIKEAAENKAFDILLIEDMNCITRNWQESLEAIRHMNKNNVRIVATSGTPYYTFLDENLYNEVKGI